MNSPKWTMCSFYALDITSQQHNLSPHPPCSIITLATSRIIPPPFYLSQQRFISQHISGPKRGYCITSQGGKDKGFLWRYSKALLHLNARQWKYALSRVSTLQSQTKESLCVRNYYIHYVQKVIKSHLLWTWLVIFPTRALGN